MKLNKIIISRPDGIGDVILTLPMAGAIKEQLPQCKVVFIGRTYTEAIVKRSRHVDEFVNLDDLLSIEKKDAEAVIKSLGADAIFHVFPNKEMCDLAKGAQIPLRIATGKRWHTLVTCNRLLWYSRRNSNLHEAQLNLKMLKAIGMKWEYSLDQISKLYGCKNVAQWPKSIADKINKEAKHIVLHPKSKGSAVEWGVDNFRRLIALIPNDFQILITGTAHERDLIGEQFPWEKSNVVDLTGKISLDELIDVIGMSDVLVAASTGPLHIAAMLQIEAIGVYSPKRPIHPGRWAPLGEKAQFLVASEHPASGVLEIAPELVLKIILLA